MDDYFMFGFLFGTHIVDVNVFDLSCKQKTIILNHWNHSPSLTLTVFLRCVVITCMYKLLSARSIPYNYVDVPSQLSATIHNGFAAVCWTLLSLTSKQESIRRKGRRGADDRLFHAELGAPAERR